MRLLQITDCHLFADPEQTGPGDINPYQTLRATLRLAASLNPDALLITGDISGDDSAASYQHLLSLLDEHLPGTPWQCIPGNHDMNAYYSRFLGDKDLARLPGWSLSGWCVHGLDTRWQDTRGKVDPNALATIEARIHAEPQSGHLLALHHHPLDTHSWMDRHRLQNGRRFLDWLAALPVAPLVVHGHIHAAISVEHGHCHILGAPSSAWQWRLSPDFAVDDQAAGLRIIELDSQRRWHSSIRRIQ